MSFFSEQLQKAQPGISGIVGYLNQLKQERENQAMYERLRPILEKMSAPTQVQQTIPGQALPNMANVMPTPQTPGLPQAQGQQPQNLQTPDKTVTQNIPAANDYGGMFNALVQGGMLAPQALGYVQNLRQQDIQNELKNIQEQSNLQYRNLQERNITSEIGARNKPVIKQEMQSDGKVHNVAYSGFDSASGTYANKQVLDVIGNAGQNVSKPAFKVLMSGNQPHLFALNSDAQGNVTKRQDLGIAGSTSQMNQGTLTPEAIDAWGTYAAQTGSMPAMGFGMQQVRAQILNNAADKLRTQGGSLAANKMVYDGSKQSFVTMKKLQSGMQTWAGNVQQNIQAALNVSANLRRTNSTALNKMVQGWQRNATTVPGLTQFELYIYTIARDYAKVSTGATSGAMLTDSATKAATSLINAAQSPQNFEAATEAINNDLGFQLNSVQGTLDKLRNNLQDFAPQGNQQPSQQSQQQTQSQGGQPKTISLDAAKKAWGNAVQGYTDDELKQYLRSIGYTVQ